MERQSKQPDGPALAITLRVNVERWKFAERFEDVAARKGAPKDANVLRQIYRAQSLAHTPQTAQMYHKTSTENSIFDFVIQLSLARFYGENREKVMKNPRYFACGMLQ